jgi:hypothetical protein
MNMRIDSYRFGQIVIDGKKFTSDLKIFPNEIKSNWWRKQGHVLNVDDILDILEFKPEVLIIGTGSLGVMKVPDVVITFIKDHNIELIIDKTDTACKIFNKLSLSKKLVAALHLTC